MSPAVASAAPARPTAYAERGSQLRSPALAAAAVRRPAPTPATPSGIGSWAKPCSARAADTSLPRAIWRAAVRSTAMPSCMGSAMWSSMWSYGVTPATGELPIARP
ncbi:hypothetical protein ACVW2K_003171 [Nocardioides sp. HB32]